MSKQINALKLALEALNRNDYLGWQTNIHVREAIREALADSALERMAENERELGLDYMEPGQPAQQPVVEHPPCQGMNCGITRTDQEHSLECQAEHAAAIAGGQFVKTAQQQEPVATVTSESGNPNVSMSWWHEPALPVGTPLYTSPPASKPWVALTSEDKVEILRARGEASVLHLTEAKLREKNA